MLYINPRIGNYRSGTGAYTVAPTDYFVNISGASATITLPDATLVPGYQYVIQHSGTSISNVYQLNTVNSQTVGGIGSGSYSLYTAMETLKIISDGSNFQIENHLSSTSWATDSTAFGHLTATNANPTQGTAAIAVNTYRWRRQGDSVEIQIEYQQTTAGGSNGTGSYLFSLPVSGMAIDTNKVQTNSSLSTANVQASTLGYGASSGPFNSIMNFRAQTSTAIYGVCVPDTLGITLFGSTQSWFSGASAFSARLIVPLSGWQP